MDARAPTVIVIGGPNGAGKSTIAPLIIHRVFGRVELVNADTIARGLSGLDPDRQAFAAGRIMLRHIAALARKRRDFAFETTLASRSFAPFLRRMTAAGYRVHIVYVWVRSLEIAIERVRHRVLSGGHSVADSIVRRRFTRSARNFLQLYLPRCDSWEVIDNSGTGQPAIVAAGGRNEDMIVHDSVAWRNLSRFCDEH